MKIQTDKNDNFIDNTNGNPVSQLTFSLPKNDNEGDTLLVGNREMEEIIKMNKDGFFYKGEKIEDVHNIYKRFNEWLTNARRIDNLE